MSIGLIETKIGMTREFLESGQSVPVTVIKVEKGRVLDIITKEKRGYNAVKVGFFKLKNSKLTKQMKGYFAKKNTEPKKILKEFRVESSDQFKEGNELGWTSSKMGDLDLFCQGHSADCQNFAFFISRCSIYYCMCIT